jgi:hypothetical protein
MLIAIGCEGCGERFGTRGAYEAHRPDGGACLPPAGAGLTERVHRDRSGHGQGGIRYWVVADAEIARRMADSASSDTDEVKAARRAELFAAKSGRPA